MPTDTVGSASEIATHAVETGPFDVLKVRDVPVYVIDFADVHGMVFALDRLTTFSSHPLARNVIVDQSIIDPEGSPYVGHDLPSETIADFLNTARAEQKPLFPEEQQLAASLLRVGILRQDTRGTYVGADGVVVLGLAHNHRSAQRLNVASHELQHGLHLSVPAYHDAVQRVWGGTDRQRAAFRALMELRGYDPTDDALIQTEFVAYTQMAGSPNYDETVSAASDRLSPEQITDLRGLDWDQPIWADVPAQYRMVSDHAVK